MEHREKEESSRVEGRNPVLEALRSGRSVDKVYIQAGLHDGPIQTILREARKRDAIVAFVTKERLNQMSETGNHQGVIAAVASYQYSTVEDILKRAEEKGEDLAELARLREERGGSMFAGHGKVESEVAA